LTCYPFSICSIYLRGVPLPHFFLSFNFLSSLLSSFNSHLFLLFFSFPVHSLSLPLGADAIKLMASVLPIQGIITSIAKFCAVLLTAVCFFLLSPSCLQLLLLQLFLSPYLSPPIPLSSYISSLSSPPTPASPFSSSPDIAYLVKIAKVLGIVCVVVVSSKSQLLEVLSAVPAVQALSVSSRNMRLWKVRYITVRYCLHVSLSLSSLTLSPFLSPLLCIVKSSYNSIPALPFRSMVAKATGSCQTQKSYPLSLRGAAERERASSSCRNLSRQNKN
jgi:hypothetical protein